MQMFCIRHMLSMFVNPVEININLNECCNTRPNLMATNYEALLRALARSNFHTLFN